jgi:hypothetical protein
MPYIWIEPAEVVTHLGVTVYHVYKNDYWDQGNYQYNYTTDIAEEANPFDIRDLESYQDNLDHIAILKLAIERGEITSPDDSQH